MKPKEKAKELIEQFEDLDSPNVRGKWFAHDYKNCALICIKEKIDELQNISDSGIGIPNTYLVARLIYLKETEQEIEKL